MSSLSVVIPTFNRRDRVHSAIRSVLEQTLRPQEVIVVDDGSTDSTSESINEEFGSDVILVKQANKGVSAARNAGVRAAQGELIAFLDSDDRWMPEKLEMQLPLMDNPEIVLSATNWKYDGAAVRAFDDLDFCAEPVRLDEPLSLLSRFEGHRLWLPTWMVRRSAFMRVGGFDERMRLAEDSRLLFRLAFEGSFNITSFLGTIRSSIDDAQQLTLANDLAYRRRLTPVTLELLSETYIRACDKPPDVQQRLRRLLAYYLRAHAEYSAIDSNNSLARHRAMEALAMMPRVKDAVAALAILVLPMSAQWKYRRMKKRAQ